MNVVVIGKPRNDITMTLDHFPAEGTDFPFENAISLPGGINVYVACMLEKWGVHVCFSGMCSGDQIGLGIKSKLDEFGIDTNFMDINYEVKCETNHSILNTSNGKRTNLIHTNKTFCTKHRYNYEPDFFIVDGSDLGGAIAASNNYPNVPMVMLANVVSNDYYNVTKRCKYVCANEKFAVALSKMEINYSKSKTLVNMMQKIKDLNNASYILCLEGHGTLFVKNRDVKYIPKIESELKDEYMRLAAFFGAYCYGLITKLDMDAVGKICNMAYAMAGNNVGNINNILDKKSVFDACGLVEEQCKAKEESPTNNQNTPEANAQSAKQEVVQTQVQPINQSADQNVQMPNSVNEQVQVPSQPNVVNEKVSAETNAVNQNNNEAPNA